MNNAIPDRPTVADLGEEQVLARIIPLLPHGAHTLLGPGDDAALVSAPDGRVVVSTDVLVEGRHFRAEWSGGRTVGRRAAAQNLADIAAMGARPTALVVALVLPGALPVHWVEELARGLADVAGPAGAGVVGGDLSGGDQVVVSVTVQGDLGGQEPVLRSGARAGDTVALAGTVGRSAAGLALLGAGVVAGVHGPAERTGAGSGPAGPLPWLADLVGVYLAPRPPLAAGPAAALAGATAMLDVSDGLLRDAGRIARASGVRIDLDEPARTLAEDLAALAPAARELGVDPLVWALSGGEDHGLLATFPPGAVLPAGFRPVGRVLAAAGQDVIREERTGSGVPGGAGPSVPDGSGAPVLIAGRPARRFSPGWDHFSGQPRR